MGPGVEGPHADSPYNMTGGGSNYDHRLRPNRHKLIRPTENSLPRGNETGKLNSKIKQSLSSSCYPSNNRGGFKLT